MIEAELKACVQTPDETLRRLDERAVGRAEVYQDTYYDTVGEELGSRDEELRVRTVHSAGETRTVLTYKGAPVDEASGSKPEHETRVEDAQAVHAMLRGLGYVPTVVLEKRCRNYAFEAQAGRWSPPSSGCPSSMGRSWSWRPWLRRRTCQERLQTSAKRSPSSASGKPI